ncbi:adenosine deaminase family protein [Roseomonas haemaphysalidis]|uniref:Adenosine deaminase n=1 Tax=Roseomonas haemaphysalidis TaxID=2768162 RepID=A0ABS3KM20_9PROT|nr:adenosine deaminase [Roseomonas haemaphysalidis]MBO1078077.1 adenosine deaminase [Roseomonas haemaphysalidis]
MLNYSDYLDLVPKVELHLHIAGAVRATTLVELAAANGVRLPRPADTLYQWPDFYGFLEMLRLGALAVRRREEFARIAFECIEDLHRHGNVRHAEIFFNPHYYTPSGTTYPVIVDGLIDGLTRAEKAFGTTALLIACIDRSVCLPSEALEMLDWMEQHPRPQVIGIGLDGAERAGPPLVWVEAWRRAGRAGLRRTAHVCEDNQTMFEGPPVHFTHCRDALGCDRLDHGYNMLANPAIVARAAAEQVPFTMACWSSIRGNREPRQQRIRRMREAGLNIVLGTDDPTFFGTNMGHCWRTMFAAAAWLPGDARQLSLAGLEASWLPEDRKAIMRAEFVTRMDMLDRALDTADHVLDLAVERPISAMK